jgi:uncharacterized damage-inducible protein DinB
MFLMLLKDLLLAEFDHEMGTTRRLLERLPDDRLGWRPHQKSMPLGDLATHLVNLPTWGRAILKDPSFDLASLPAPEPAMTTRTTILDTFDETVRHTRSLMDQSDTEYAAPWSLLRSGQQVFSMPRVAAFRTFVISHTIHHRGQLSVYLRINGIPLPPIYGPSADEA